LYSLQRSCGTAYREGVIQQPTKEVQYIIVHVQPTEKLRYSLQISCGTAYREDVIHAA
jgi:hypothetical protein